MFFTNTITGTIIKSQEDILTKVVALTAFIPLLTGTGGNVGAQSSTVVIRGINTEEIRAMGPLQVIGNRSDRRRIVRIDVRCDRRTLGILSAK